MKVSLVGNPNAGKSTLFNALTGLNQRVGNYPGITVDIYSGSFRAGGKTIQLVDLPGVNSIYPKTTDEKIVTSILFSAETKDSPGLVVVVLDATQLKRGLILATQIIDLQLPCIVALNMMDEAREKQHNIDIERIEQKLGVPVVGISAKKHAGIKQLKTVIAEYDHRTLRQQPPFLTYIEDDVTTSNSTVESIESYPAFVRQVLAQKGEPASLTMAKDITARYRKINKWLSGTTASTSAFSSLSQKIDAVLTHKYWGIPIAFFVLLIVFQAIFTFAEYPMQWIEAQFNALSHVVASTLPPGWLTNLLAEGLLAGLAGVFVFVPQIAILFALLALLEGTGYMVRISYMLDRLMTWFGLSGKAVVPLMSSFACAIPAIMATRSIQNRKERLITIMVTPLLSCSARLPVYVLLIGLFIPSKKVLGFFNLQGLTMMGFYVLGLVFAVLIAALFSHMLKTDEESRFMLELPRYRWPQWRNVLLTAYQKAKIFVWEAGRIILVISILLWMLASYGPKEKMQAIEQKYDHLANGIEQIDGELKQQYESEKLTQSYAGHLGKYIEPVIKPLGYDWKIGISLLTSFVAREVFVGTMATIYSIDAEEENPATLRQRLLAEKDPETGKPVYTIATVFSLLVFYAFAMQCISTFAVVRRETQSWKWPVLQMIYLTILAYVSSFLVFFVCSKGFL